MFKRILLCVLFFIYCPSVFAGLFFNVVATGPATQLSMTICLNGQGPLSCQNYNVTASNLSITTTIPNHNYPNVGIKINTPGYVPTGCTMNSNGYCLFPVSNTSAATIPVSTSSCQTNDLITFTPTATYVNNPTGGSPNAPQQFTINMSMCNSQGQPLIPSASNPVHLTVYGAPSGAITPTPTTTSTGLVTFTYSGQTFPNNILINAWISDPTNNGVALGQTQVLQQNTLTCSYLPTFYDVPLTQTLPDALQLQADVGYSTTDSTSTLRTYTLDTGSLGVVVPAAELPSNANVIGPGPAGVTYYDSSGNTFSGNYYLAPVRVQTQSGTVMTQPIMVLAINKGYCSGPQSGSCYTDGPPAPTLHYLGVGFDRSGSLPPGDTTLPNLFGSPASNAFLHVTNNNFGTDVSPGYYIKAGDSGAPTGLTLGIHSTTNYNLFNLTASSVPGDFLTEYGCYGFTNITTPVTFCGTLLLDVGIDEMFIDLPKSQWPAGTFDSNNKVPVTIPAINMSIAAGTANQMAYTFDVVQTCPSSTGPNAVAPCYVQWIDSTKSGGQTFVNTGRRALYKYDYLYQGQCGQVGFYAY